MSWFNYYGFFIMVCLMIPNIVMALRHKETFENHFNCKTLEIAEQIGRYGAFILMVFNIPFTYIGWIFYGAEMMYVIVNSTLIIAYELIWLIMRKKNNLVKAILLSVIPSVIFIFSGIMIFSILLMLFSIVFAICHITISVKNASFVDHTPKRKRNVVVTVISLIMALIILGGGAYGATIVKAMMPVMKAKDMTAKEMLAYDVRDSDHIISVAIIKDGDVTYSTYGESIQENTLYDYEIGSISKTFLGLMYSKLIDENKFSHATTNDFYNVTKEQLLDRIKATTLEDRDYLFCYSNFGIAVLGLVLEEIYDCGYTDLLNDFIHNELRLQNSTAAKQSGNLEDYWKWKPDNAYIPAGSIISDIHDMAKYVQICLTDDSYIADSFNAVKSVDANNSTYLEYGVRIDSVGMTWMCDEENGYVWHNGSTTDFNSYLAFDRESGIGVVLLGNFSSNERITLTVIGAKLMNEFNTLKK